MKGCVEYRSISHLTVERIIETLINTEKLLIEDACLNDFAIRGSLGNIKLHEFNYKTVFGYGVYVLFENNIPVYVGMTADNFLHRILSHCNTDLQPFWGWNALLKKIAVKLQNQDNRSPLTKEALNGAIPILKKYGLLRINVLNEGWDKARCKKLEKILMRGFAHNGYELLNTRFGKLHNSTFNKSLCDLTSSHISGHAKL